MFSITKIMKLLLVALVSIVLTACDSSEVDSGEVLLTCNVPLIPDAAGTSCVAPPPIECPVPTVPDALNEKCVVGVDPDAPAPTYSPSATEAVLYYNRNALDADNSPNDPSYDGYRLHTWNNATCDSYDAPHDVSDWANGHEISGIDPTYGAYWVLNLKEGHGDCANFIIHVGTDDAGKALGNGDFRMPLMQDDETYTRMNFTFHGVSDVYEFPVVSLGKQPLKVSGIAAHWIDANTFAWKVNPDLGITTVKLHYSATAGIEADENDMLNGTVVELTSVDLTDEQKAAAPLVADYDAFAGDWTIDDAKAVLKAQTVLAAYNADGETVAATYVQADKVLDAIYTTGEMDADEAQLGVQYNNGEVSVSVWAPTAQSMTLKVFDAEKTETASHAMTEDAMTGIWSYTGDSSLDRAFYQFEVQVYHYQNSAIETLMVTDPYSVSLSTNGEYSQFVNLADTDLMPEGWDNQTITPAGNYEDAVIYEAHIRDFSVMDESTTEANRGKYKAFTELDSLPMQHLQKLVDSGLNTFHMLPANDIASINEDPEMIIDLTDTVADLCAVNADAPVCGVEDDSATLQSVLESYNPLTNDAAALVDAMRGYDSFNWGYDPKHFNVPDGIYASNADGVARITEMREMIMSLHDIGLRVVLDVVYNHTNSAGLYDNSVFDKLVPGYYHSRDLESGAVIQSTCCNDTALEHRMMDKFMVDSLAVWAEQYKMDGFRFDIMSHGSKDQMLAARDAIQLIDTDNHFYGEGWGRDNRGFDHADQGNMAGTEMGTYNDRLRDAIRYANFFKEDADAAYDAADKIKFGMAGTLADYVLKSNKGTDTSGAAATMYAKDPADVINYISKHDNETLWDQLQFSLPIGTSNDERVRIQNMSHAIVLLSQGIPFMQLGSDFLRSKSLDGNTYDAGDWYNFVDFSMDSNNYNVGLPLEKRGRDDETLQGFAANFLSTVDMSQMMFASNVFNEYLSIRHASPLFKLTTADDIIDRVGFHNIGKNQTQNLIVMSIDDGTELDDLDANVDALVVVVNGSDSEQSHTVNTAVGFELHNTLANSVDSTVTGASFSDDGTDGTFTVPARTVAVFVKPQGETQGTGLSAYATSGAPDVVPYGDTVVYVKGSMNGWADVDALTYVGDGVYELDIMLSAGDYEFKVASEDWSTVNNGSDGTVELGTGLTLVPGSNNNIKISITEEALYTFTLDASDIEAPVLTVDFEEPYFDTTVYIRGAINSWGTANPFVYLGGGKYAATVTITAGTHEFKVADADWGPVNMGAPSDSRETFAGDVKTLVSGSNDNFYMEFAAGDYTFVLDASNENEQTLQVYSSEFLGGTDVYVRGDMNGWGTDNGLAYQSNGSYSVDIELTAGTYGFKLADADWASVNIGAGEISGITVGDYITLAGGDNPGNLSIVITDDGTYRFTLSGPSSETPTLIVTQL